MKVPFSSLDPSLQEALIQLSQREFGYDKVGIFVAPTETKPRMAFFILFGALSMFTTLGTIWTEPAGKNPFILLLLTQCVGLALVMGVWKRWGARNASRLKPALIITPILVAKTGLENESVEMHYLRDAVGSYIQEQHHRGIYCGSLIHFYFQEEQLWIFQYFKSRASQASDYFEQALRHLKSHAIQEEKYPALNWPALPLRPAPLGKRTRTWVRLLAASCLLGLLLNTGVLACKHYLQRTAASSSSKVAQK